MKKLFAAGMVATVLAASTALAFELPATQAIRPTEGPALPAGVPDIYDPEVRAHFQPVRVANLRGNPDFPVVLAVNTAGEQPRALLLGLDARNGKSTWSLTTDPVILIAVLSDKTTIQGLYVDIGFADVGKASGSYAEVDNANSAGLPDLLDAVPEAVARTYI